MNGPDHYRNAAELADTVASVRAKLVRKPMSAVEFEAQKSGFELSLLTALVHAVQANTAATVHLANVTHEGQGLSPAGHRRHVDWIEAVS